MSEGIIARLRSPLAGPADLGEALAGGWTSLAADALARRPVTVDGRRAFLGDLFELSGSPAGRLRFVGDLSRADRVAAALTEGLIEVDGDVGDESGLGMAGGALLVRGRAGARLGAAAQDARRGMTGGEILVLGEAGPEAGARMRRGLIAVAGRCGSHAGVGLIAGTIVVGGAAGASAGLWSKRGSIIALGSIDIPPTYRYACTYQPVHIRLTLGRLRARYGMPVDERHITGRYRRYSGDLADLGKGEILAWTAS